MTRISPLGSISYADIPVLETARLRLRAHKIKDLEPMSAMWADPQTTRFIGNQTRSRADIWKQIQRCTGSWALLGFGYWVITDIASGAFIGEAGFMEALRDIDPSFIGTPEAGWVIAPKHWNKGYASEALQAIHAWGDAHFPDRRTVCIIEAGHTASIHVAKKYNYVALCDTLVGQAPIRVFERIG